MTPEELEAFVLKMRELGVAEANGITLGPDPRVREKDDKIARAEREARAAEHARDVLFAASSIKPRLRLAKGGT